MYSPTQAISLINLNPIEPRIYKQSASSTRRNPAIMSPKNTQPPLINDPFCTKILKNHISNNRHVLNRSKTETDFFPFDKSNTTTNTSSSSTSLEPILLLTPKPYYIDTLTDSLKKLNSAQMPQANLKKQRCQSIKVRLFP